MKKIISVLMVAVCLMMAAPAQAQLHFGVKGGLNISKLSFSKDAFKGDNKTGFFVGPMAEFTLPYYRDRGRCCRFIFSDRLRGRWRENNEVKDICSSCEFEMVLWPW